jgi:hypothetical protein
MRQKDPTNVQAFVGHPLRIAKQVLTTMAAASQPEFLSERRDLVHFLLDRESVATEGQFQLAMYLCPTATGRSTGLAFAQKNNEAPHRLVEFALPPFGYVLTVSGQPLDSRPIDISRFTLCSYATEERIDLASIPILPTHLALPGDYRSADEIRRDVIENILIEQDHPNAASEAVRIMEQGEGQRFFEIHGEDWDKL